MTWTVLKLLQWTSAYFESKGIPNPQLDAEYLLAKIFKYKRLHLYLNFEQPLKELELQQFKSLVNRRAKREPLQYILGKTEFWSREFRVGPGVLIPRQETERLIEKSLEKLSDPVGNYNILDLGTGSGNIGITLALERDKASLWATDMLEKPLQYAQENAKNLGVENRITFLQGRNFVPLPPHQKFDLIVANLPYIPVASLAKLQPEVQYEPQEALNGGPQGTEILMQCLSQADSHLQPGGWLILEMGEGQGNVMQKEFANKNFQNVTLFLDYAGKERGILGQAPC